MRRRRSVVRSAGRTAVIAGAATAASGKVAHSQQQRFASAAGRAAPRHHGEPASSDGNDMIGCLKELADLRSSGALSEKEFAAAKAKLLAM